MTYPEVQFVAAPEDGAEVLFDFNDDFEVAPSAIIAGSFTLGAPSIDGDPDGLGVQYGPREVGFDVLIFGNRYAAMQTQALMARTFMLRRRGWLRVKMDFFSAPVWLRTYTPTPAELDFSLVTPDDTDDAWRLEVRVAAEPFIRGERIELGNWLVSNNPAAAYVDNRLSLAIPDVVGDAAAPLRISASFSADRSEFEVLWSCAAVPDGYLPIVWEIGDTGVSDGWTLGADTSASVVDATASGGSRRAVTFTALEAMSTRLAGTSSGLVPPVGRYRVMLRTERSDSDSVFAYRFGYRTAYGDQYDGSPRAVLDRDDWTWLDLGDFEFPLPRTDVDMPAIGADPEVALAVERVSGAGNCHLDALLLVPVDLAGVAHLEAWEKSDTLVTEFVPLGPSPGAVQLWDGDAEVTLRVAAGGELDATVKAATRGTFPTVRPGVNNLLTLLHQVKAGPSGAYPVDSTSATATVSLSYQPRWLWLGGS